MCRLRLVSNRHSALACCCLTHRCRSVPCRLFPLRMLLVQRNLARVRFRHATRIRLPTPARTRALVSLPRQMITRLHHLLHLAQVQHTRNLIAKIAATHARKHNRIHQRSQNENVSARSLRLAPPPLLPLLPMLVAAPDTRVASAPRRATRRGRNLSRLTRRSFTRTVRGYCACWSLAMSCCLVLLTIALEYLVSISMVRVWYGMVWCVADSRGLNRRVVSFCDVGAFEWRTQRMKVKLLF